MCPLCDKLKKIGGSIMARWKKKKSYKKRYSRWRRF